MRIFRNTCPNWCASDHDPEIWDESHAGHTEHQTVVTHEGVTVDVVQLVEWSLDDEKEKWKVVKYPPAVCLGPEFDNAVNLTPRQLRHRIEALELAQRRLTDLALEFAREGQ